MEVPLKYKGKIVGRAKSNRDGSIECTFDDGPFSQELAKKFEGPVSFGFSYPKPGDEYRDTAIEIDFPNA
jgi:hypothetical protein